VTDRRNVLITGCSGGLGRALVEGFYKEGWSVVGTDVESDGGTGLERFVAVDLGDTSGVAQLADALEPLDRLDAVVNNAAVQVNLSLLETDDDSWRSVFMVNLDAAFRIIRWAAPHLAKRSGAIVNISSVHAVATSPNVAAYAVSKGALVALTRSAALELASDGVRCNAVLPGALRTRMLFEGLSRRGVDAGLDDLAARTPLGRIAEPEEVVPTVIHLADGRRSGFLTGQAIAVDGGATLRLGTE
jgi:NAD(P)-dependent dehydrogenase (short-subunit alcohol dehydrogenase family)